MNTLLQLDWTLFVSALISSTLFPGGSEALLLYRLNEGNASPYQLLCMATVGNVLGSIITYGMGRLGLQLGHQWFHIPEHKTKKAEAYFTRFGQPALLFAWLPIIGDPLCLVAGVLRMSLVWFIVLVSLGKLARYSVMVLPFI